MRKLTLERFTTYRKEDFEILNFEEELENSNNFDEKEQSNKKDSTFEDIELVNKEIKQLTIKIF